MRKLLVSSFLLLSLLSCNTLSTHEDPISPSSLDSGLFLDKIPQEQDVRTLQEHPTTTEEVHEEGGGHSEHEEAKFTPAQSEFWLCIAMAAFCICFAGAMSGLTVGYLSIDELLLELKMKNGTNEEKADAMIIIPILAKHHLLLSTLLLANAFAMEALPLFLDAVMPAYLAVIFSTSCVVIFGEIVPQAYCTGPAQIKIARQMAPMIKFLMLFFYPICYPISVALDKILGTHSKTRFVKKDLKALIELHKIERSGAPKSNQWGHEGGHEIKADAQLTADEIRVINSTIDLRETPVTKEMERIEKLFMLSSNTTLDLEIIKKITKSGYSKVPVFKGRDKNNIIGILKVKSLLNFEKFEGKTLEESGIQLIEPLIVAKDTSMLEMLMLFQEKKTSVALVSEESVKDKGGNAIFFSRRNLTVEESKTRLIGLISLKDIFEEILESKMVDDDEHGAVTLMSGRDDKFKKRFNKAPLGEIQEASERPEKGLKKPLLEY